ncbi:NAD-dependent epimerase/dehydratase family protein [Aeromicrobium sp. UC242_57]|uniref:NAD-dependent epimerase/dehydratase family protein n=1 Tax=Aeromicrobium sp. UC242_57 TaxID=3374624 RepID=UPI0037895A79
MRDIDVTPWDMLSEVVLVIGVPFVLGLTVAHVWPQVARAAHRAVSKIAFLGLAAIIVVGVAKNWDIFIDYIGIVLLAVFLHDALALALGYGIARGSGLSDYSRRAMTFEVGIRNAGLGLLLVFEFFDGLGGMALVAAWWGIWGHHRRSRPRDLVGPPLPRARTGRRMSASRVLVTGGNGFLGRSVVRGLAACGLDHVVSTDIALPESSAPGVVHEIVDVTDAVQVGEALARHQVDTVVHLASIVNPGKGMSDSIAYRVDVDGSRHVVEGCVAHGVRRIVVSSSGAAYGYHADNPAWITEDQPVRGNDVFAYSRHKRLVEDCWRPPAAITRAGAGRAAHRHDPRPERRQPDHRPVPPQAVAQDRRRGLPLRLHLGRRPGRDHGARRHRRRDRHVQRRRRRRHDDRRDRTSDGTPDARPA